MGAPLIVNGAVNCSEAAARRFLGMSPTMFTEYKRRRIIRPLRKGLYCYEDLALANELIRAERDGGDKVLYLRGGKDEEAEGGLGSEETEVGSKRRQPRYRSTKELLGRIPKGS